MVQFPPKFVINWTILIQSISLFWVAMYPGVPHMGYAYLNLLDPPELLQILVTLTAVIKPLLPNFLSFDALTELGAFMRSEFLCISVLRVESGPRVKLAGRKSALTATTPVVYSTDRSKAVVPMLVLLFVALWFILRGDLF